MCVRARPCKCGGVEVWSCWGARASACVRAFFFAPMTARGHCPWSPWSPSVTTALTRAARLDPSARVRLGFSRAAGSPGRRAAGHRSEKAFLATGPRVAQADFRIAVFESPNVCKEDLDYHSMTRLGRGGSGRRVCGGKRHGRVS